jgi:ABC-type Na+ efflux pump permease subunit
VFVSERLNGSMEILLTCGLSRVSILAGKILYIVVMSVIFGFLCLGFSLFGSLGTGLSPIVLIKAAGGGITVLLYLFACFMNAACGAWLSMRLPNPRLSHFANLFVLGIMVGGHSALAAFVDCPSWLLPALLLFFGVIFMFMAVRDFEGEHAIQPFSF